MNEKLNQILLRLMLLVVVPSVTCLAQTNFDPVHNVPINIYTTNDVVEPGSEDELIVQICLLPSVFISNIQDDFFVKMKPVDGIIWQEAIFPMSVDYEGEEVFRGLVKIRVPFTTDNTVNIGTSIPIEGTIGYQMNAEGNVVLNTPLTVRTITSEIKIDTSNPVSSGCDWTIEKPVLIGGNQAICQFIEDHHLFPAMSLDLGIGGVALIGCTVDVDGKPIYVHLLQERPKGLGFGEAGVEVIENMMFTPARQGGNTIQVPMQQSITFIIE